MKNSRDKKGRKNSQTLKCKGCGEEVHNCGLEAVAVTCDKCVRASMRGMTFIDKQD